MTGRWALLLGVLALAKGAKKPPPPPDPDARRGGAAEAQFGDARSMTRGLGLDGGLAFGFERDAGAEPDVVALPSLRVHVFASEELSTDALRRLVRPETVLWLDTRSNMLRDSTLEVLRRAADAWVRVRAPVSDVQQRRFATAPRVGIWVSGADVGGKGMHRLGGRKLAVELSGLDGASIARAAKTRPEFVWWQEPGCDRARFSEVDALSGIKVLVGVDPACRELPAGRFCVALRSPRAAVPVGADPRSAVYWIAPDASPEMVQDIYLANPAAELAVTVGADEGAARRFAALLEALQSSTLR